MEWFIESKAFSPSTPRPPILPPPPLLPSVSSTGDTQEDWVRETTFWRDRGARGWMRSRKRPQECLILYKPFNTLWFTLRFLGSLKGLQILARGGDVQCAPLCCAVLYSTSEIVFWYPFWKKNYNPVPYGYLWNKPTPKLSSVVGNLKTINQSAWFHWFHNHYILIHVIIVLYTEYITLHTYSVSMHQTACVGSFRRLVKPSG
jgi:hypothetical protein